MQAKQNLQIQRELSNLKNRPKSNDRKKFEELYNKEIKEFELPRSGKFNQYFNKFNFRFILCLINIKISN
jgi:hypothetical protein